MLRTICALISFFLLACSPVVANSESSNYKPMAAAVCSKADSSLCAVGEYCFFERGSCGDAEVKGTCRKKPEICNKMYSPVCGCDAKRYSNECMAAATGISVRSIGDCP